MDFSDGRVGIILTKIKILLSLLCVLSVWRTYAEDRVSGVGKRKLGELVSGATARIQIKPGVTAAGRYYWDGTAKDECRALTTTIHCQ